MNKSLWRSLCIVLPKVVRLCSQLISRLMIGHHFSVVCLSICLVHISVIVCLSWQHVFLEHSCTCIWDSKVFCICTQGVAKVCGAGLSNSWLLSSRPSLLQTCIVVASNLNTCRTAGEMSSVKWMYIKETELLYWQFHQTSVHNSKQYHNSVVYHIHTNKKITEIFK